MKKNTINYIDELIFEANSHKRTQKTKEKSFSLLSFSSSA